MMKIKLKGEERTQFLQNINKTFNSPERWEHSKI
jgi:hypothetical protein